MGAAVTKALGIAEDPSARASRASSAAADAMALKRPDAERENRLEAKDKEKAMQGIVADLVLIYPIESEEEIKEKAAEDAEEPSNTFFGSRAQKAKAASLDKKLEELEERQDRRAKLIIKLRQAGLMTQLSRSRDGKFMYLKVWATLDRLILEAGRQGIEMLVTKEVAAATNLAVPPAPNCCEKLIIDSGLKKTSEFFFGKGDEETERTYRDFEESDKDDFERKKGRLFSSLERQRIIYAILEGAEDIGGAQQDLDDLVADKALCSFVWPHSSEKDQLWYKWGAMDELGPITGELRTKVPDTFRVLLWMLLTLFYVLSLSMDPRPFDLSCGITLGVLIAIAGALGMFKQPLHEVRDYFGEKTAFYFAWMEHYETFLIYLSILALIAIAANASEVPPVREGLDESRQESSAYSKLIYCIVVAVWTTLYMESWKRKNAVLAYIWDVTDFEEEEDPRPEFLANFANGRWRPQGREEEKGCVASATKGIKMEEGYGFFTSDGRFVAIDQERGARVSEKKKYFPEFHRAKIKFFAIPQLFLMTAVMIIGALSILVFKMLVQVGVYFRTHGFWSSPAGQNLPLVLSMLWIQFMNGVYTKLATALNDLENYRTETEYQDQRILKVMVFTFINSYITLIYIGFIKASGYTTPFRDENDNAYRDLCGFLPGVTGGPAPWDGSGSDTCGVMQGCFRYANTVPECSGNATFDALGGECCNFNATSQPDSGCNFVFVQRDCSSDLRQMMVSYTLLKTVYEGLLQIGVPFAMMLLNQYKLAKQFAVEQAHVSKAHRPVSLKQESTSAASAKETGTEMPSTSPPPSPPEGSQDYVADEAEAEDAVAVVEAEAEAAVAEDEDEADEAALPSPPPSPPSVPVEVRSDRANSRGSKKNLSTATPDEQRLAFHKSLELELTHERFPGTFAEFLTKVIQFGYIAMFSAAFPIAAISSAVGNFIEIRLDAIKVLESRRRRYEGAEDIGSWQSVLAFMSWIALPMNVALFVFTSWTFRQYVLAPGIATHGSCSPAIAYETTGGSSGIYPNFILQNSSLPDADATLSPRARFYGTDESFVIKCEQNINDCWAPVGGVEWLPALQYLVTPQDPTPSTTIQMVDAICDDSSPLYNKLHCTTCQGWASEVLYLQMLVFVVVEHLLLLLKMFLAYAIPDSPQWVRDATARADFLKSVKQEVKRRNSVADTRLDATIKEEQVKAEISGLKKRLNEPTDGQKITSPMEAMHRANSGFV